ncbi:MAG: FHA domain-containing protein [Geminicoccaceae bacterium]
MRHEIGTDGGTELKTLVIGRSPSADVVIADASVAPHHAELVVTADGRLYLTDCATAGGTWRQIADGAGSWHPVRQAFVGPEESLRLGDHRCTASDLLRRSGDAPIAAAASGAWNGPGRGRIHGPAVRDPATGEIVRRRP